MCASSSLKGVPLRERGAYPVWILCSGIEVPVAKGKLSDWRVDHLGFVLGWEEGLLGKSLGST